MKFWIWRNPWLLVKDTVTHGVVQMYDAVFFLSVRGTIPMSFRRGGDFKKGCIKSERSRFDWLLKVVGGGGLSS